MADAARILKVAQAMCARRNRQPWAKTFPEFKQHWIDAATHACSIIEPMALVLTDERDRLREVLEDLVNAIDTTVGADWCEPEVLAARKILDPKG